MDLIKELQLGNEDAVIAYLNKKKVNLKKKYANNLTLLHYAAYYQNIKVVKYLLQNEPTLVNMKTIKGLTPLHLSVEFKTKTALEITQLLINKKADINATTEAGRTPLHIAAHYGSQLQARILLQHNAVPESKNKAGFTPNEIAEKRGHHRLAAFLSRPYVDEIASDTDSEDEDSYCYQEPIIPKAMKAKPDIKDKKEDVKQARIAHFRGSHFYPSYTNRTERKSTRSIHKLQNEGILPRTGNYSSAAHDISKTSLSLPTVDFQDDKKLKELCAQLKEREENLANAMQSILDNMSKLQQTGKVTRCLGHAKGSRTHYDSRYLEFVQLYVNSYKSLMSKLEKAQDQNPNDKRRTARTRNEIKVLQKIGSKKFPLVSTSEEPRYALEYAFALVNWDKKETHKPRPGNIMPLEPMFQPDGHPRFPYLGILYVYLHSKNELGAERSTRILDLFSQNLIDVKCSAPGGHANGGYVRARERAFIGGIESHSVKYALEVRVPNFSHEYKEFHKQKYGLTSQQYNYFKDKLALYGFVLSTGKMRNENNFNRIQQEIIEHVVQHYQKKLYKISKDLASIEGGNLRFLDVNSKSLVSTSCDIEKFTAERDKKLSKKKKP